MKTYDLIVIGADSGGLVTATTTNRKGINGFYYRTFLKQYFIP